MIFIRTFNWFFFLNGQQPRGYLYGPQILNRPDLGPDLSLSSNSELLGSLTIKAKTTPDPMQIKNSIEN